MNREDCKRKVILWLSFQLCFFWGCSFFGVALDVILLAFFRIFLFFFFFKLLKISGSVCGKG